MKKLLAIVLAALMIVPVLAACQPSNNNGNADSTYKVAMITDYGDITDESFNQTTYEACKEYCDANNVPFRYYKPASDSTPERVAKVEEAIDAGYNIIVMPGFAFAGTIYDVQDKPEYKDIKFIALDVSQWDVEDCFYNHDASGARTDLIDPNNKAHIKDNVYCAVYQEELCGYMAGYAAVKLGYKHLGFLGGMAVPAVIRYGYGFVQGCDAAAVEMGIADQVSVEYVYGNKFSGDPAIAAYMDTWYKTKGVEVVFACGGGIYTSAVEAAKKANGKVIGVDVDQAATIKTLSGVDDMTVTSAMKGLAATVKNVLNETIKNNNWSKFGTKVENLGLVSGTDPELNYVQIPMKSTQWGDGFTQENYKELVNKMFTGEIKVSNAIDAMPSTTIAVSEQGNIL
ncbi:MAG: BMP family ABC transporter substrate-binding protein [Clostridia bacterium]|nr:BMP family ABC transporter substrate-binding protein [Clostridia bacterium]